MKNLSRSESNTFGKPPLLPIRFLPMGVLFGQEALEYDNTPEANSLLTDADVAEMLIRTGNPQPPHHEYLAQFRSLIAAHYRIREVQSRRRREKKRPDQRIADAVGVLRSAIPDRLKDLEREVTLFPADMRPAREREITRLKGLLAAASEMSQLKLERNLDRTVKAHNLVGFLAMIFDNAYGPTPAWKDSVKTNFITTAVAKAGWKLTPGAIEQYLLRVHKGGHSRTATE